VATEIGTGIGTGTVIETEIVGDNFKGENLMPDEERRGEERGERGDRDRDREERWDVKPERPHKLFIEAAEDVEGALRVCAEIAKDVIGRERMEGQFILGIYDRVIAQREL
jgi:hypothetical protein